MKLVVFLSTGRCGTQFFATYLADAAAVPPPPSRGAAVVATAGRAVVVHEPIGPLYAPNQTLRAPDLDQQLRRHPAVKRHLAEIESVTAAAKLYVETGWPVFSWIPLLLERFGDWAIVIHMVRNPVRFAFSMASHGFFSNTRDDPYIRLGELHPTGPGVKHRHYATDWESLNAMEKSLFQWLEINDWAEELKAAHPEQFITVRAEDGFAQPQILVDELIERRPSLSDVFRDRPEVPGLVDKWHYSSAHRIKSLRYAPEVEQVAARYGYSMDLEGIGLAGRFVVED